MHGGAPGQGHPLGLRGDHLVGNRSHQILYLLPRPDLAGRTALRLSALEFLDRLAKILPPPRIHRHRYHGVLATNAPLRPLVTARARAREDNALDQSPAFDPDEPEPVPDDDFNQRWEAEPSSPSASPAPPEARPNSPKTHLLHQPLHPTCRS